MMSQERLSRRSFIKQSSATAIAATTVTHFSGAPAPLGQLGSLGNLRIGFVGPGGRGFRAHVGTLSSFAAEGVDIELPAVCDVYSEHTERAANAIAETTGKRPKTYDDYREMYEKEDLDAVCIGTPDHWHAKQVLDAFDAGLHVYCEKPMTKTVEEAIDIVKAWQKNGKVMQVGVQSTSLPVWGKVQELLQAGYLGKVLMYQTEFFRNSTVGQWRYYTLSEQMNPSSINWDLWLGAEEGLAEKMPFDRAVFAQWRRFWPFGAGMYTDLFVHRTTSMLKATGLRFPGRVVGSGGIYLEYDGRDVPDVATVVAEFNEGVQGLVTATMCCQGTPIRQLIRGHYGSFVFGNGEQFTGFDFVPEGQRITGKEIETERIEVGPKIANTTQTHFSNWLEAIKADDQMKCNNPPDLGASAMVVVNLGARSYQEGKVFHFDPASMTFGEGNSSWAKKWESMSRERGKPKHIPGWHAGSQGSSLEDPDYQRLEGPWVGGKPPEKM
jgi:predicted dehydrogenase